MYIKTCFVTAYLIFVLAIEHESLSKQFCFYHSVQSRTEPICECYRNILFITSASIILCDPRHGSLVRTFSR